MKPNATTQLSAPSPTTARVRTSPAPSSALLLALSALAVAFPAHASVSTSKCFDFNTRVIAALHEAPVKAGGDSVESGKRSDGTAWAAVRGGVNKPFPALLARLLDPETTRDPQVNEFKVEKVESPQYLAYIRRKNMVKQLLIMEVRWVEDWVYAVVEGTPQDPKTVVISYQKSEGTQFMERFCGSIVLRHTAGETTEVSQYEESRITGQGVSDRVSGLNDLLAKLRK